MILASRHSDQTRERRWHVAVPGVASAPGLVIGTVVPQITLWAVVTLMSATMGILTGLTQFWVLPLSFLGGTAAARASR